MRPIDADALKNDVIYQTAFLSLFGGKIAEIAETLKKGILEEVEKAPTIDAEPVVRCEDCKHSKRDDFCNCRWCQKPGSIRVVKDEFYCAWGERRDNAE